MQLTNQFIMEMTNCQHTVNCHPTMYGSVLVAYDFKFSYEFICLVIKPRKCKKVPFVSPESACRSFDTMANASDMVLNYSAFAIFNNISDNCSCADKHFH